MKIAYIAPEIPALSATFVYHEILQLEQEGFDILPISIHVPQNFAMEDKVKLLAEKTIYFYKNHFIDFFWHVILFAMKNPHSFFRVFLIALKDAFKLGLFTHRGRGIIFRFLTASKLSKIIKMKNCRRIHANFAHIPTDIAMYASMLTGIPFSFTSHANDLFERGWLISEKIERSDFNITISEFNKKFMTKLGGNPKKIDVIHCGINPNEFVSCNEKEKKNNLLLIGTLGRLVEKKGIDVLIYACNILKEKKIDFLLEIGGSGPLEIELKDLVKRLGLSNEVKFKGIISHGEVHNWLCGLDIFVLACKKDRNKDMDGIPVVLMEAMISGIQVVSTKLSGIPELIEDGVNGFLSEPDNPFSLSDAILRSIKEPNKKALIFKNAKEKINNDFNISKNVKKLARRML
ncbi:MAG: glycosyltransferase family 4 protein [Desulfobacterales bacterium]|nr:glycosyltransferase family 4 protein [Desulfobacterales bacterium]MBF0395572.1 glycosyltransferase family 4 protein [Desulfobacterales bacterium]